MNTYTIPSHEYIDTLHHDLGNLFYYINSIALDAQHKSSSKEIYKDLSHIIHIAERGARFIALGRLLADATAPKELPLRSHTLSALEDAVRKVVASNHREHGAGLAVEPCAAIHNEHICRVSLWHFNELVGILTDNAMNYRVPGTAVPISLTATSRGETHLQITNKLDVVNGSFEEWIMPFWRGETARNRAQGNGIGLAAAATIAKLHNATLTGQIREMRITVSVLFPAAVSEETA